MGHIRHNAVAYVALFIALSGSAYAAGLAANSVGTKQLKNGAVTGAKVAKGSLTGSNIDLGTLGTVPSATYATTAGSASSALTATTAETATTATTATTAGNATELANKPASDYTPQIVYTASSGAPATLTANASTGTVAELPLDGVGSTTTPASTSIDIANTDESVAETFPTNETITGITLYVSTTSGADVSPVFPVSVTAQLYTSAAPSDTFTAVSGVDATASPSFSGVVVPGSTATVAVTGLSVPVTAQTRGMVVVSLAGAGDETLPLTIDTSITATPTT